jgi:hydroxymethylglutaryl-CoA lyase
VVDVKRNGVTLVEVGLRDGLQNESISLSLAVRLKMAQSLSDAGLRRIEIGSFVSPKWVPSMEMSEELTQLVFQKQRDGEISSDTEFSALVPNEKGMEKAVLCGVKEISLFAACTESFSYKNINCTMEESFKRFKVVSQIAKRNGIKIRGYLSVCFACPFEGKVNYHSVKDNVKRFIELGAFEVSIGDTVGAATAGDIEDLYSVLLKENSASMFAGHYHDTRGQALANILKSYQMGVRIFDSSIGGLGGCPYSPGATGNVATEDVVYLMDGLKVETGVNLRKLIATSENLSQHMNRKLSSRVTHAGGVLNPKGPYKSI